MSAYNKIKVEILKFGSSNIFSIFQACKEIGFNTKIVTNGENKFKGNILILPGVGSFPEASKLLKKKSLNKKIIEFTQNKNNYLFGVGSKQFRNDFLMRVTSLKKQKDSVSLKVK